MSDTSETYDIVDISNSPVERTPLHGSDADHQAWPDDLTPPDAELVEQKGWRNSSDLLRQSRDLEAMVGSEQVRIPGADAPPDEVAAFWSRIGCPESPDGYEFSAGDIASGYDTELSNWFREAAHAVHMPADMAKALHDQFRERADAEAAGYWSESVQDQQECESVLKRDWGRTYDARLEDARRAVNRIGGDALRQVLNDTGIGDHPAIVRAFADMGRLLTNSSPAGDETTSPAQPTIQSAVQAQREILRLRSDDKFMAAYGDRSHPSHDVAQGQLDELYAIAYPASLTR